MSEDAHINEWRPDPNDPKAVEWGARTDDGRRVTLKVTLEILEAIKACKDCKVDDTKDADGEGGTMSMGVCERHAGMMEPTEVGVKRSEGTHRRRGFR